MNNTINSIDDLENLDFKKLKVLDQFISIKKSDSTNKNHNIFSHITLVENINDVFYTFDIVMNDIDVGQYTKSENDLRLKSGLRVNVNPKQYKRSFLNFPNKNIKPSEITLLCYGLSEILLNLNGFRKYQREMYNEFKNIPNKNTISKINIDDNYMQSLFVPMNKNCGFVFSIIHEFYHNTFNRKSPNIYEKEDLKSWKTEYLISFMTKHDSETYAMHLNESLDFDDFYNKVKKYYHCKQFDIFDKLIDISKYKNIDYATLKNKNIYNNLIKEFTTYFRLDRDYIESFFKPIYINENNIRFYKNTNRKRNRNSLLAIDTNNKIIKDIKNNQLISDDDLRIVCSILDFNLSRIKEYSTLTINPYNGKLYKQHELTKDEDYKVIYHDIDSIIITTGKLQSTKHYIKKINGYYVLLFKGSYGIVNDHKLIGDLNKRLNIINILSS